MTEAGGCAQEGKRQWLTIVSEQRLAGEILKKEEDLGWGEGTRY